MMWFSWLTRATYRNYEFFIVQNILSILSFIIFLWPHVKVSITEGLYYVYACIAVWGFSILVRFVWETAEFAGLGKWKDRATLQGFGGDEISGKGDMTRLLIETNRGSWEVGQYVYLRVPSINPFVSYNYDFPQYEHYNAYRYLKSNRTPSSSPHRPQLRAILASLHPSPSLFPLAKASPNVSPIRPYPTHPNQSLSLSKVPLADLVRS